MNTEERNEIHDYCEELSNIGMYVLNTQVDEDDLPQIIQKVHECGERYNEWTQKASQSANDSLREVRDKQPDNVTVATMGILFGTSQGLAANL